MEAGTVTERIRTLLALHAISYREVQHGETHTSEESAKARGESVTIGGKALLMKAGEEEFKLFVVSAALKTDGAKIRNHLGVRKLRFAATEELLALTGLVPGSVPPFGRPVLPFDLYVDVSITRNEKIAFNAGSLTTSIIMSCSDYLAVASPTIFEFSV
jgi:Ala-tRNA(Pro) deacylase